MNISENKIKEYIDVLSSKSSMPGGGAVASISGAEATSLILMVCNLTVGKEKYKDYENLIREKIKLATKLRDRFLELADLDITNFKLIEKAFAMPKETDEEKALRKNEMEKGCKKCCEAPKEMIEKSLDGLKIIKEILGKSSALAVSDLGVAAIHFKSASHSAWLNILINLKSIDDVNFINEYFDTCKNELSIIDMYANEINRQVIEIVGT